MTCPACKLVVIGLQQTFLRMVLDQLTALLGDKITARALSLNELEADPPRPDETLLYFAEGLAAMVKKVVPASCPFICAKRENLIFNMHELFSLKGPFRILVVNDVKNNTDDMTRDLNSLGLNHEFLPYYPDRELPDRIDYVVTAGERMLIPPSLGQCPIIDIGLRFLSLSTVYQLFEHFGLEFDHADLARHYMRVMMMLSEKWPVLGHYRYRNSALLGTRTQVDTRFTLDQLITNSPGMKTLCRDIRSLAATGRPVFVFGRTGTGKTRICQIIHNASPASQGPFVSINCAARSMDSLDKELFGWEDNGAVFQGLFEAAEHGTLCIEEIGRLTPALQARLLQALSENRIIRCQGQGHVPVQVRIISTSSRSLDALQARGFNPKLILALTAHVCRVPELSERMEDFRDLITHYLSRGLGNPGLVLPRETLDILMAHPWEGNVQELFNVLQHMACMAQNNVLDKRFLPYYINVPGAVSSGDSRLSPRVQDSGQASARLAEFKAMAREITRHGFLSESRAILSIYQAGKEQNKALGRGVVLEQLQKNGYALSVQQLRLRLERMDSLGLLIVRPGRGGTTLSDTGQAFLDFLSKSQ